MNILKMALWMAVSTTTHAKDIELSSRQERHSRIKKSKVWQTPPINLSAQDIFHGPAVKGYAKHLTNERVYCRITSEDLQRKSSGKTPKFFCQLLERKGPGQFEPIFKDNGERRVIKVKYSPPGVTNNEVKGEILGTRLLWALGFYADQMFYANEVYCYGCTNNPFTHKTLASENPLVGTIFNGAAIEKKVSGDEILSEYKIAEPLRKPGHSPITYWSAGVEFREMMNHLPRENRAEQLAQRDALRLMAIFLQHTDLKADNQRMLCTQTNKAGACEESIMMIQDIGTSFGVTFNQGKLSLKKLDLQTWANTPIWKDPANCVAQISLSKRISTFLADGSMSTPQISEAGRAFLAKLLTDFSEDQSRVIALFQAARIDASEIPTWVAAFNAKVRQIQLPMGSQQPQFRCPQ